MSLKASLICPDMPSLKRYFICRKKKGGKTEHSVAEQGSRFEGNAAARMRMAWSSRMSKKKKKKHDRKEHGECAERKRGKKTPTMVDTSLTVEKSGLKLSYKQIWRKHNRCVCATLYRLFTNWISF